MFNERKERSLRVKRPDEESTSSDKLPIQSSTSSALPVPPAPKPRRSKQFRSTEQLVLDDTIMEKIDESTTNEQNSQTSDSKKGYDEEDEQKKRREFMESLI